MTAGEASSLRILVVAPTVPYPPNWGFGIRVFNLLKELGTDHEVSLACFAGDQDREKVDAIRSICSAVHTVAPPLLDLRGKRTRQLRSMLSRQSFQTAGHSSPEMTQLLRDLSASGDFDVVQFESSQLISLLPTSPIPVLLDEHNIEYELLQRMMEVETSPMRKAYNWREYRKFEREETAAWARVDGCVMTSDREAEIVRNVVPQQRVHVAPNGVDVDYFSPVDDAVDPDEIVFTGLMSYRPNNDAARFFAREVLPIILASRPTARLTLVGLGAQEHVGSLAGPNVSVVSDVPDVRPYVRRASVVAVPLRMGSGTRLKVLEGLSMGKALVSTSVGCEGIAVRAGEHLLIEDDATRFADAVVRLLDDAAQRARLGVAGRELVESAYSWSSISHALSAFQVDVVHSRR
jgi:sugar transferase (PEP-CTERM/EpsH1 system associated)